MRAHTRHETAAHVVNWLMAQVVNKCAGSLGGHESSMRSFGEGAKLKVTRADGRTGFATLAVVKLQKHRVVLPKDFWHISFDDEIDNYSTLDFEGLIVMEVLSDGLPDSAKRRRVPPLNFFEGERPVFARPEESAIPTVVAYANANGCASGIENISIGNQYPAYRAPSGDH